MKDEEENKENEINKNKMTRVSKRERGKLRKCKYGKNDKEIDKQTEK